MLELAIDRHEKYAVVTLQSEKLNSLNAPDLKSALVLLNNEGVRNIIVSVQVVRYSDSSGLSALLVGQRLCKDAGGTFVIAGPCEAVDKVMKIAQLDKVLHITPSLSEAIDLVFMEEVERDLDME